MIRPLEFGLCVAVIWSSAWHAVPAVGQDRRARDANVVNYGFEDELIHGALPSPQGEVLLVRRGHGRESLVRAREQFIAELLKTVEDL